MRGISSLVVIGIAFGTMMGCSRSSSATAGGASPAVAPATTAKRPKYESELFTSHTLNGGTGNGTFRSTTNVDGKPFTAIDNHSNTIEGGATTLTYAVTFTDHRDGKDIYKVTYTVQTADGAETTGREVPYDGTKTVLLEDKHLTLVLQPPSSPAEGATP
jgi:hypothetical protein